MLSLGHTLHANLSYDSICNYTDDMPYSTLHNTYLRCFLDHTILENSKCEYLNKTYCPTGLYIVLNYHLYNRMYKLNLKIY